MSNKFIVITIRYFQFNLFILLNLLFGIARPIEQQSTFQGRLIVSDVEDESQRQTGLNFTNVLHTAFTHEDLKSIKKFWDL